MIDLSGRIAIVTGASRGIGRAIATMLAQRGAHVVAAAREDNARAVADEIVAAGGKGEHIALDVTEPGASEAAVSGVLQRHGRIDVLVNNAGIAKDQLLSMIRTRRFVARPLSVVFGAIGSPSPAVRAVMRDSATPLETR